MVCSKCGKTIPDDWKFCMYCGGSAVQPTGAVCSGCGKDVQPGDAFCKFCGTKAGGPAPAAQAAPAAAYVPAAQQKKASGYMGWIIGGIVLFVAAAAVLALTLAQANGWIKLF